MTVRGVAEQIAASLEEVPYEEQPGCFFERLQETPIPFAALDFEGRAGENYAALFEVVYLLGRSNLALTIASTMHLYVIHGLAHLPMDSDNPLAKKRHRILSDLRKHKIWVAVSTFGSKVEGGDGKPGVKLSTEGKLLQASGKTVYQSLASSAGLVAFTGLIDDSELAYFLVPLKKLQVGDSVFDGVMAQTDTRTLDWSQLQLPKAAALLVGEEPVFDLLHYQTAWFQGLLSAAYLGAASRALEEARKLILEKGFPSSDRDATKVGRLALKHRHILGMVRALGPQLGLESRYDIENLLDGSSVVKYLMAEAVQEIASGIRAILGAAAVKPGSLLARLVQQLAFAQVQPMAPGEVELDLGRQLLNEDMPVGMRF